MQTTLKHDVPLVGIGLHSGRPARVTLRPADADTGIRFRRVDLTGRDTIIPARYDLVSDTTLNTRLTNAAGVSVSTVEHLMAAIAGTGLHNVLVDIDGPEIPIMDGSARRFVRGILDVGLRRLGVPLSAWAVTRTITLEEGDVSVALSPHSGLTIDFEIDFTDPAIGRQALVLDISNGTFIRELSDCRTFCRRAEVDYMQSRGLALGGTLENAVVIDGEDVLNPEGFRRADECVRHKMLDALGDLTLAGGPVLGAYKGRRAGHGPTNRLLRKAFATEGVMKRIEIDMKMALLMPGVHLHPADLAAVG